jgi:threonine dehydrogenase-like Zn-dependent dehydrogenase
VPFLLISSPEARDGQIDPGNLFDLILPLDQVAEAYRAIGQRHAIKVLQP